MTIAAGFLCQDGAVLCADTLLSGSFTISRHKSKLTGYRFDDGVALFALAGHVDMAEAAIQQCERPLYEYSGKPRTHGAIASEIRRVLAAEFKTHVVDTGLVNSECEYAIIIAIQSDVNGIGLYSTSRTQMKRSRERFEIIGEGASIGHLAILRFGDPRSLKQATAKRTALMAAYAIGEAKRYQEGSVGGGSVILLLQPDGRVVSELDLDAPLVEKYASKFQQYSNLLMSMFLLPGRDEQFKLTLERYPMAIQAIRDEYLKESESSTYIGTAEMMDVVMELDPRRYLAKRLAKEAKQLDQKSAKRGRSRPQPSQE